MVVQLNIIQMNKHRDREGTSLTLYVRDGLCQWEELYFPHTCVRGTFISRTMKMEVMVILGTLNSYVYPYSVTTNDEIILCPMYGSATWVKHPFETTRLWVWEMY